MLIMYASYQEKNINKYKILKVIIYNIEKVILLLYSKYDRVKE